MYRSCPSVPCLLLFTYRFRYVSLNSYGKRNSHSKDTARTAPQRAAPQWPHPLVLLPILILRRVEGWVDLVGWLRWCMTKCIKRIRDLFEYALYKFTLYLLTYLPARRQSPIQVLTGPTGLLYTTSLTWIFALTIRHAANQHTACCYCLHWRQCH